MIRRLAVQVAGGFSTKVQLRTYLGGLPIAFHLTGGEALDNCNFETLLNIDRISIRVPRLVTSATIQNQIANLHARQSRIDPTLRTCPPSFRKHSIRRGHASNKRLKSVSHFDARRRRRITARSSRLLSPSS
jgi:hypothetical protein